MKRLLPGIYALLLLAACGTHSETPTLDISAAMPAGLEEIATYWELLPVDESDIPMPAVTDIKRYGDRTFIKSGRFPDVPKIYMMEGSRMAAVLDAYGRGPGEYQDAESFAYCEQTSELIINDRRLKGFRRYHVPDMKWVSDEPAGRYLIQFETLNAARSVFFADVEDGKPGYFVLWDHTKSQAVDSLETSLVAASLMQELHLTKDRDGSILFALPGQTTQIRRATGDGFSTVSSFALIPDAFGAQAWEARSREAVTESFRKIFEEGTLFGLGAEAPVVKDDKVAFWYVAGIEDDADGGPVFRLAVSGPQGSGTWSEIRLEGYPEPLQQVGVGNGQWCSVLLLDLLEDVPAPKGKVYPRLRELADQGVETVLLFWSAI